MSNRSKAKGTKAETSVVNFMKEQGIPAVRPSLKGSLDSGDVWLWPFEDGGRVVVEVKDRPSQFSHFPSPQKILEWWEEATKEKNNTPHSGVAVLVVKPKSVGYTRVGEWWAWVNPNLFVAHEKDVPHDGVEENNSTVPPGMWLLKDVVQFLLNNEFYVSK